MHALNIADSRCQSRAVRCQVSAPARRLHRRSERRPSPGCKVGVTVRIPGSFAGHWLERSTHFLVALQSLWNKTRQQNLDFRDCSVFAKEYSSSGYTQVQPYQTKTRPFTSTKSSSWPYVYRKECWMSLTFAERSRYRLGKPFLQGE